MDTYAICNNYGNYYIGAVSFINHQKNESFLTRIIIRSRNLLGLSSGKRSQGRNLALLALTGSVYYTKENTDVEYLTKKIYTKS